MRLLSLRNSIHGDAIESILCVFKAGRQRELMLPVPIQRHLVMRFVFLASIFGNWNWEGGLAIKGRTEGG